MPPFLFNFIKDFHCRYCRNNKVSIVMLLQQKFTRQYAQVSYFLLPTYFVTKIDHFEQQKQVGSNNTCSNMYIIQNTLINNPNNR